MIISLNTLLLSKIRIIIIIIVMTVGNYSWSGMTKVVPNHCNCLEMGEQSQSIELLISDFQNQGSHKQKLNLLKIDTLDCW